MRKFLGLLLIALGLWWTAWTPLPAQQPAQQPAPAPAEKKEPEPTSRDGSSMLIYYGLGIGGAILVLLIVCVPARRD